MAGKLGISAENFYEKYTRVEEEGGLRWLELKEVPTPPQDKGDGLIVQSGLDCALLDRSSGKAICSVYETRPLQCRTWPFWSEIVESKESWEEASKGLEGCPGINSSSGTLYSVQEIESQVEETDVYRNRLDGELERQQ